MPFTLIPFLLLAIPLMEIGVFIAVGSQIGVFPTLAMVVITAIGGSILLRAQGFGLVSRMRGELDSGRLPGRDLVHGVMILIAGVLLLTPGFVTDALGFLLFVPTIRDGIWRFAKTRVKVVNLNRGDPRQPPPRYEDHTIDLGEDDYSRNDNGHSPWSDR